MDRDRKVCAVAGSLQLFGGNLKLVMARDVDETSTHAPYAAPVTHTQENSEGNSSPRRALTASAEKPCRHANTSSERATDTKPSGQNYKATTANSPSQNSWEPPKA